MTFFSVANPRDFVDPRSLIILNEVELLEGGKRLVKCDPIPSIRDKVTKLADPLGLQSHLISPKAVLG